MAAYPSVADTTLSPRPSATLQVAARVLDATAFADAVAIGTFIARRDRYGGPAAAALDAAFDDYEQTADALNGRLRASMGRTGMAKLALGRDFKKLKET